MISETLKSHNSQNDFESRAHSWFLIRGKVHHTESYGIKKGLYT